MLMGVVDISLLYHDTGGAFKFSFVSSSCGEQVEPSGLKRDEKLPAAFWEKAGAP